MPDDFSIHLSDMMPEDMGSYQDPDEVDDDDDWSDDEDVLLIDLCPAQL